MFLNKFNFGLSCNALFLNKYNVEVLKMGFLDVFRIFGFAWVPNFLVTGPSLSR